MTTPAPGILRVSADEREAIVDRLNQAYAEGRLDKAELDMRLHLAMTAKTRADLDAVLYDLNPPAAPAGRAVPAIAPYADPTAEQRLLAALAHVLGIFTLFVGPLIMMCTSAKRHPYVRAHIATAFNFQLTLLLATIVTFGVAGVLYAVTWIVAGVAGLLALTGRPFRYPFTLRLMR